MDEFERAYNRSLRFLSFRPRSEKEILDYLKKKKTTSTTITKVMDKLKSINLVNDEEFVKWWIEQRTSFKQRGMRVIKMELKQKGIGEETIDAIIHNANFTIQNETELAKKALEKKMKAWGKFTKEVFREKAVAFLLRRGFDYEMAKVAINGVLEYNKDRRHEE